MGINTNENAWNTASTLQELARKYANLATERNQLTTNIDGLTSQLESQISELGRLTPQVEAARIALQDYCKKH